MASPGSAAVPPAPVLSAGGAPAGATVASPAPGTGAKEASQPSAAAIAMARSAALRTRALPQGQGAEDQRAPKARERRASPRDQERAPEGGPEKDAGNLVGGIKRGARDPHEAEGSRQA